MATIENSVGRLYRILSEAKYATDGSTRGRLARVFGVDPDDQLAFFHSFAQLFELVDEAEEQMQRLISDRQVNPSDYLKETAETSTLEMKVYKRSTGDSFTR